uniref:Ribonuclease H-like domain-containing protein n=1 Tax=Tanacetum cinerariifolium TaxID=118510 RepID=A0A6L2LJU2_TANCI|nr:ribonuclease H-like domain-containing protein [Tanacetum cinerariifolium]
MSGEELAPQMAPVESLQMVSSVKLFILKKGEYTLWSIRMEQYLTNTDYGLWQEIINGDEPVQTTRDENGVKLNLLEVHGATVSNKHANQKFLRALPSSWNNIALIMRNKEGIDELDIDDLYNNIKVFEADIKGHSSSGKASSSSYTDDLMFLFFASQRGYFVRECRAPRNQGNRNGDASVANIMRYYCSLIVTAAGISDRFSTVSQQIKCHYQLWEEGVSDL